MIYDINEMEFSDYEMSDFLDKFKAKREAKKEVLANSDKGFIAKLWARTPQAKIISKITGKGLAADISAAKKEAKEEVKEEKKEARKERREERKENRIERKAARTEASIPSYMKEDDDYEDEIYSAGNEQIQTGATPPESKSENKTTTYIIIGVIAVVVIGVVVYFLKK